MNLIVVVDQNYGIGNNGQLLCYLKPDLAYFKAMTLNKTVVMGRKTLETLPNGKPLKDRNNIVLTNNPTFTCEGSQVCHSIAEVLELVKDLPSDDILIIGGQSVYEQFLPYCSGAYITKIDQAFEADTFLPDFDKLAGWSLVEAGERQEFNGIRFRFMKYENTNI